MMCCSVRRVILHEHQHRVSEQVYDLGVCTNEQEQVHQKERVGRHKAHWVLLQHQAYSHDGRQHLRSNEEHDDLPHDDGDASHVLKP